MEALFTYLIKSSAVLGIFYIIYVVFLNKETFFELNRFYLISGIVSAFTIPLITITKTVYVDPIPKEMILSPDLVNVVQGTSEATTTGFTINWFYVLGALYLLGMLIMFTRLIVQLISVYRIIKQYPVTKEHGIKYIETDKDHTPFSFFSYVVYNPNLFSKEELDIILKHEKAHSKERHSLDILVSKITQILQWINPFAWLYQKSIAQNLEYLADQKATSDITCKKTYQFALLKATNTNHLSITNNFFNSLIKKRIIMLQQKKSKKHNMLKLAFVVPILVAFVFIFNTEVVAQVRQTVSNTSSVIATLEEKTDDNPIKIKIDKNTTKADLERMKKQLKEEGVSFKYKKLKFNDANELIGISVSAKDKNGNSGSYALSSDKGIKPFTFSAGDGAFGFSGGKEHITSGYAVIHSDDDHDTHGKKHKKIRIEKHGDNHSDGNVWISDDGKEIRVAKSKVVVIGDEDGKKEEHKIKIHSGDHKDAMIIINGKEMNLDDIDMDIEELMEGKNFKIDLDIDTDGKKMIINGKEMDMEKIMEKVEKELGESSHMLMLKSDEIKEMTKEMKEKMKEMEIRIEKEHMEWNEKGKDGKIKKRIIKIDGDDDNVFFFDTDDAFSGKKEFNFVDDPDIEKIIIIDGKESDFLTLKKLEKDGKLHSVDILKSSTAQSIYGKKAKDGAIIVTTKK